MSKKGKKKQNSISRYFFTLVLGGSFPSGYFRFIIVAKWKCFFFVEGRRERDVNADAYGGGGQTSRVFVSSPPKKAWAKRGLEREHFVLFFTRVKWILFDIQHLPYACANFYYFFVCLSCCTAPILLPPKLPRPTPPPPPPLLKCSTRILVAHFFFVVLIQHLDVPPCVIQSSCVVLSPTSLSSSSSVFLSPQLSWFQLLGPGGHFTRRT